MAKVAGRLLIRKATMHRVLFYVIKQRRKQKKLSRYTGSTRVAKKNIAGGCKLESMITTHGKFPSPWQIGIKKKTELINLQKLTVAAFVFVYGTKSVKVKSQASLARRPKLLKLFFQ